MRRISLVISFCFLLIVMYAQTDRTITQYLLPQFTEGIVQKKSGEQIKALMNYNTLTEEMIFQQNGQPLALTQLETIDSVIIQNRTFIPAGNRFYEVVVKAPAAFCIQYQTILIPPGNETGYGKSQTTAITNVADIKSSGRAYALSLPDDYKLREETHFLIRRDNSFIPFKNAKDVKNIFSEKADDINNYLKTNKVDFKNKNDVAKLIMFCNSN